MDKLRLQMNLCAEILQRMSQADNVVEILEMIATKLLDSLLDSFHVAHVSIYKLNKSANGIETGISGSIVAEAIALNGEFCSQAYIENLLSEKYEWEGGLTGTIIDFYKAKQLKYSEINLAKIFTGKAYLFVPVFLAANDRDRRLWGFLTVHKYPNIDPDIDPDIESESLQNSWNQDDLLMLQQIAMQIEIALQRESLNLSLPESVNEQALRKSEARLAEAQRVANLGNWEWDLVKKERTWSEEVFNIFGRDPALGIRTHEENLIILEVEDRAKLNQAIQRAISFGESYRLELRMLQPNNSYRYIETIGHAEYNNGEVIRLYGTNQDISDRKENELKFKAIFNNTFQFIGLLSLDGIVLEANQTALDFGGLTRDEVVGKVLWESFWFSISEAAQTQVQQSIKQAAQGEFIRFEIDLFGVNQTIFTIDFSLRPLKNESGQVILLITEGNNISEFKAIEKALRKSESRLAEAQRVAKIGNWEWNVSTNGIIWSIELFNIFKLDPAKGAPTYKEHEQLFVTESREKLNQYVQRALDTGEPYRIELKTVQPDRYIEAIGYVEYDDNGQIIRLYGTDQDISDRKQTEAKLASAYLAEVDSKAKIEFLAIMSHEIRTPMNAVIGMTGILLGTPLSSQQQQYVATIRQGGEMLLSVINNFLDFSRIESGHFELEENPLNTEKLLEEVLDLMTSSVAEKSLELISIINLDVPKQIIGDHNRLRQILVNLVSNAIKFTEIGEIVITVDSKLIDQETNNHELLFNVHDTGIGIPPEAITRLFQAFSQADKSVTRQYGGTGLGLVICKQLCELMDGHIDVKSTIGEGTTFSFSIRVTAIATENLSEPIEIAPELKGKSILSVNSNSKLQQAISLYTQSWDIDTQVANSVNEALEFINLCIFDAVLIDIQLGEVVALELARTIQDFYPTIDLVLLTTINASTPPNSVLFADTITKPLSASKLYQTFMNLFTINDPQPSTYSSTPSSSSVTLDENFAKRYPYKILVVEDNLVNQQILLLLLENLGYEAEAVENGLEAVEALTDQAYDLIFMDMQMPIMDGLTASKNIRQLPNRHPWIIGLSANAFSEARDAAISAGMDEYLTKPLQMESLIAALQGVPPHLIPKPAQLISKPDHQSLNLVTLTSLEKMIGAEDLFKLINTYLEHSAQVISNMKAALKNKDFATIESENHSLKGGSSIFGATQLINFCQEIQSLCKSYIQSNNYTNEDIAKIESILQQMEVEFDHVSQEFQARERNN